MCNPNVFTISQRYLCYFVLHCLQRYKSVYKLMLVYYYYWNMCSLIILLHVGLHVHILKITYYHIPWLTCTLQKQYLQLKYNTDTDIDSRTIELYAPLNNLISLRQQWIGCNIYKQTVMTVTRIITYFVIVRRTKHQCRIMNEVIYSIVVVVVELSSSIWMMEQTCSLSIKSL